MPIFDTLVDNLKVNEKLCVCYSGGVDSAFLLKVAHDVLGDKVFAVIADTDLIPRSELNHAITLAEAIGAVIYVIKLNPFDVAELRSNDKLRCYYCKKFIFSNIKDFAEKHGATAIADGKNLDDTEVFRPGARAAEELSIISPLASSGFRKADIREHSRKLGLPTWDKPANACLATRLPYDTEITKEKLEQIEKGEEFLQSQGFKNIRLRVHGEIARIETSKNDFGGIIENRSLVEYMKNLGFKFITLDLEGFRSGSFDE